MTPAHAAVFRLSVYNAIAQRQRTSVAAVCDLLRNEWRPAFASAADVVTEAAVTEAVERLRARGWLLPGPKLRAAPDRRTGKAVTLSMTPDRRDVRAI